MDDNLPQDPDTTGLIRVPLTDDIQIDAPIGQVLDFHAGKTRWMHGTVIEDLDDAA